MDIVLPESVVVREVCPRDGLQILKNFIPTESKIQLIRKLESAGCNRIEATAFVHPKWVAQLSDSEEVAEVCCTDSIEYSYLVPNKKGIDRALACGAQELVLFLSASEEHNKDNVNKTVAESLKELVSLGRMYASSSVKLRVNIATAFGYGDCVPITKGVVENICEKLVESGYAGITLCDSTGVAEPEHVFELCSSAIKICKNVPVGLHLHQAGGREYSCIIAGLKAGITYYDSAAGGLGGCPFAQGASGNIPTEILCQFFAELGVSTGIDLKEISDVAIYAKELEKLGT